MDVNIISGIISGSATLITGGVAIIIYFGQKREYKKQTARVLLTEIRIAEANIKEIREKMDSHPTDDLPCVFLTKNWRSSAYLFVSDFDQDELNLINNFYDLGERIEQFAKRKNDFFWMATEERAKLTAKNISKYINKSYTLPKDQQVKYIVDRTDYLSNNLDSHNQIYTPSVLDKEINSSVKKIPSILTNSCGVKFKKIAKIKK